jgi:diketogulonate reductase-like aldo/keto reductase
VASVKYAIDEIGYRHIDTAKAYNNEHLVGEAIRTCGVPREELFITSKLYPEDMGYEKTLKAFEKSCKQLQLDYLGNSTFY